jgi:A/G-specific adenine glycosylase
MIDRDHLVGDLLSWYGAEARDLPWRRHPAPWRVLVAEAMLQQTRIATVLPRYESFLSRFPDPAAMAAAEEDDVVALWSGLGYYRRARNLHATAVKIVREHDGRVPDTLEGVLDLPGVGEYTAGAVLSVAFGKAVPLVDGNVERVFSRLFLVTGNVKRGRAKKRLRELAAELVRLAPPDRWNQALMELGALVCLPRSPRCGDCPVRNHCRARAEGRTDELPELPAKRETVAVRLGIGIATSDRGTLLVRAPEGGLLAGTWMPPFAITGDGEDPADALRAAGPRLGVTLSPGERLGTVRHRITFKSITGVVYSTSAKVRSPEARWVSGEELSGYGLSSLAIKSLRVQLS